MFQARSPAEQQSETEEHSASEAVVPNNVSQPATSNRQRKSKSTSQRRSESSEAKQARRKAAKLEKDKARRERRKSRELAAKTENEQIEKELRDKKRTRQQKLRSSSRDSTPTNKSANGAASTQPGLSRAQQRLSSEDLLEENPNRGSGHSSRAQTDSDGEGVFIVAALWLFSKTEFCVVVRAACFVPQEMTSKTPLPRHPLRLLSAPRLL